MMGEGAEAAKGMGDRWRNLSAGAELSCWQHLGWHEGRRVGGGSVPSW